MDEPHNPYQVNGGNEPSEWWKSLFPEPRPRSPAPAKEAVPKTTAKRPAAMITEPMTNQKRRPLPQIRLSKWNSEHAFRTQKQDNPEQELMGIGIRITMRCSRDDCTAEYYGEYVQHSSYNTTFRFVSPQGSSNPAKFDNKFLKITQRAVIEVHVFAKAHNLGCVTKILHAADAIDEDSGEIFYCWITEECIPLNQCLSS